MHALEDRWTWGDKTPEQYRALLSTVQGGANTLGNLRIVAQTVEGGAEAEVNVGMSELHRATVRGLGVARIAWTGETGRAYLVAALSASGKSATDILREAQDWETAWRLTDPVFIPTAGLTLAGLQGQIATLVAALAALREKVVLRRQADARLAEALAELNDIAQAWYAVATTVWDAETTEGATLRGTIPTTYRPRYAAAAKRRRAAASAGTPPPA